MKPTIAEAICFAKKHRFNAPVVKSRHSLLWYIRKNVRWISIQTLNLQIKYLKKETYAKQSYKKDKDNKVTYCSDFVSDIYNINFYLKEGREAEKLV